MRRMLNEYFMEPDKLNVSWFEAIHVGHLVCAGKVSELRHDVELKEVYSI